MKWTDILKLLPSVLVTAGIAGLWYDDFVAFMIMVILFYVTIPVLIAAIVFFFMSLKMSTVGKKVIFFYGIFNVLLLTVYLIFGKPQQECNPDIMEKHYEKHAVELDELCQYTVDVLNDNCGVTLEWYRKKLHMFHVEVDGQYDCFWNEDAISKQDSLMQVVGLTQEEMDGIHRRLKKVGCIGIEASRTAPDTAVSRYLYPLAPLSRTHAVTVWFRRVGMGRYDYIIHDAVMTDEEKKQAMEYLEFIPYNERVVFQFRGGAIGPQVFGKEIREKYLNKHKPW